MAVSWPASDFQKLVCWNPPIFIVLFGCALLGQVVQKRGFLDPKRQQKNLTVNWKAHILVVFGVFLFCLLYLFHFLFSRVCFVFFLFLFLLLFLEERTCFPPKKRHFCLFFSVSLCFSLAFSLSLFHSPCFTLSLSLSLFFCFSLSRSIYIYI